MTMKDWLQKFQPLPLYIVLILSIAYFLVQLLMSHITHALTLLVDAYHMLCNIIALSGCILTIKHCNNSKNTINTQDNGEAKTFVDASTVIPRQNRPTPETSLRNTFGWTRIDVLTMLVVCIFLASLSFSLLVEALQTLIHIDHQDTIHYPLSVMILGISGLILNVLCYLLIGGYTFHQGSFFHITSNGDVVLDNVVCVSSVRHGERRLSRTKRNHEQTHQTTHQRKLIIFEIIRDISSTIFVIICCIIVYFAGDEKVTKFVDPLISMVSCVVLLVFSYPYMKESCFILLQTIPGSIDINQFKMDLMKKFQEIVNVHDLHIWQLTAGKYVLTAHMIFKDPNIYAKNIDDLRNFFNEQGITIVTIQPEFCSNQDLKKSSSSLCLMECLTKECMQKGCCNRSENDDLHGCITKPDDNVTTDVLCLNAKNLTSDHCQCIEGATSTCINVPDTITKNPD